MPRSARSVNAVMRVAILFVLTNFLVIKTNAFPSYEAKEGLGGLISDKVTQEDRVRIDEDARTQLNQSILVSKATGLTMSCFRENLTFQHSDKHLYNLTCNLTIDADIIYPIALSFETDIQDVARLQPAFWIYIRNRAVSTTIPLNFTIKSLRMGSTYLKAWVNPAKHGGKHLSIHPFHRTNESQVKVYTDWMESNESIDNSTAALGFHLRILRPRGVLELAFRVVVVILVCAITFLIGCELNARRIWEHLKHPVGPIIGFVCQFGLMPLISFAIAMSVPIKTEFGFGLLTTGCCPGGGGSNIWTLLLHGDIDLGMTMTFMSSISALGLMPLMLWVFGRFFIDIQTLRIPYLMIAGQLCYIAIPVTLGMIVNAKLPKVGSILTRLMRPLSFLFIATIIAFGVYTNLHIYRLLGIYPVLIPTAAALPWIAFLLAGLIAWIFRRSRAEILTISIETGIQSAGIAILVLIYSMPQPEGDMGATMPIVVSIFTPLPLVGYFIVQMMREGRFKCGTKEKKTVIAKVEDKGDAEGGRPLNERTEVRDTSENDNTSV